jgi:hypothetical protein
VDEGVLPERFVCAVKREPSWPLLSPGAWRNEIRSGASVAVCGRCRFDESVTHGQTQPDYRLGATIPRRRSLGQPAEEKADKRDETPQRPGIAPRGFPSSGFEGRASLSPAGGLSSFSGPNAAQTGTPKRSVRRSYTINPDARTYQREPGHGLRRGTNPCWSLLSKPETDHPNELQSETKLVRSLSGNPHA